MWRLAYRTHPCMSRWARPAVYACASSARYAILCVRTSCLVFTFLRNSNSSWRVNGAG